jgi:acyl-CoA thioester hydrolase
MSQPTPAELALFPVVISLPVQWGEQDLFGHVNNTVFFRWFESARIAYLDRIGLSHLMAREQIGPILAAIGCNYRRQLTFPDMVDIGSRVTRIGRSSLTMVHALRSRAQEALVADGESTIVTFDYRAQHPVPVPDEIRAAIAALEGQENLRREV